MHGRRKYYPWPWAYPSVVEQDEPFAPRPESWLDEDLPDEPDDEATFPRGRDVIPPGDSDDSDYEAEARALTEAVADEAAFKAYVDLHSEYWPIIPLSEEERDDLPRRVAYLEEVEKKAAEVYDPDEVVALIAEFYQLIVEMGHWEPEDIQYAPHSQPVDTQLARDLGYDAGVIALMEKLPYVRVTVARDSKKYLLTNTAFANYTDEADMRAGRQPPSTDDPEDPEPPFDSWLLPLTVPGVDPRGWTILLDTRVGLVRAHGPGLAVASDNTAEWLRHGPVPQSGPIVPPQRVPGVPAARYFAELIFAYRSLACLPLTRPEWSFTSYELRSTQGLRERHVLMRLYRECGWPDKNKWHRAELLEKWRDIKAKIEELAAASKAKKAALAAQVQA